ncbi:MAG: hypothetical protein AAB794_00650 [Patescibacteria group bacterium]
MIRGVKKYIARGLRFSATLVLALLLVLSGTPLPHAEAGVVM